MPKLFKLAFGSNRWKVPRWNRDFQLNGSTIQIFNANKLRPKQN